MNKKRYLVLAIALTAALAAAWAICDLGLRDILVGVVRWIRTFGELAPLALGVIYVVATLLWIPGSWLTLAAGFLFGVPIGLATTMVAGVISAALSFMLSRTLFRRQVTKWCEGKPRFQALDQAIGREGFRMVLLVRLSPLLPFGALNYMFGATRARFIDFFFGSTLGMLPGTLLYVYLGSTVKSLADMAAGRSENSLLQQVAMVVGLAMTLLVTLYVSLVARRAMQRVETAELDAAQSSV